MKKFVYKFKIKKSLIDKNIFFKSWHKHPFAIPVFTLIILSFATFGGFILFGGQTSDKTDKKIVSLYIDGHKETIPTRAESVRDLLSRLQITLDKKDVVEPAVDAPIVGNNFSINVYKSRPVTVVDEDGKTVVDKVANRKPAEVAKKVGFKIYPEDIVTVDDPDKTIQDGVIGEKIIIKRALPVKLSLFGKTFSIRTQAKTVGELAKERGIDFTGKSIYPSPETKLKAGSLIVVTDPGKKIEVVEETIEPDVTYVDSTDLDVGQTEVRDPGSLGKRVAIYSISKNGEKTFLQEIIVLEPQKKLVARGVKTAGFSGGFDAALSRLRSCEGSYTSNTGNGYYGAYQFNIGSWQTNAPAAYRNTLPSDAPPGVQDLAAATYYQKAGWGPWPACSVSLGLQDVYR